MTQFSNNDGQIALSPEAFFLKSAFSTSEMTSRQLAASYLHNDCQVKTKPRKVRCDYPPSQRASKFGLKRKLMCHLPFLHNPLL